MAIELAKAYVQIIPSARGIGGMIQKEEKEEREHLVFSSGEEFEKYRKEFFAKIGGED